MSSERLIRCSTMIVLGLLSGSHVGCTIVYKPKIKPVTQYPANGRIDLRVHVHFNDDFMNAEWRWKVMTDTYRIPIGEILKENTHHLANSLFREVVVTQGNQEPPIDLVDATLIPKVVSFDRSLAVSAFAKGDMVISIEWPLAAPDGTLVWVATIQGKGTAMMGNMFTHRIQVQKQVQGAVNDLFAKSHAAISSSPEIKAFAGATK